ncbi:HlyD family efflux transporter periplasmic adaptor subunit [Chryseobacterium shandongense]|jgi:multidrug efflux pump subunit AcrA (membrane-fusion protein)|uniref:HlyD family efflux transporter periplasmic adaptor subunit n=1 Tax=Chryseobacterium shandongense TaxID=1493872 RepID=A0AAD1DM16_9FLAO|nr:HlyD family efflux transporter periplasmic adaptor subunit [Chryseobacterium shandongense]AZA88187.1 HlyD family efflux transporter periplasmic adaptor subunit [Chryseobacterium shandongense]AZA96748.1 HlyD family efflux transporter periplasmic adaptor subunit [Chryseobacterium shandongense]
MKIQSFDKIYNIHKKSYVKRWFLSFFILAIIVLFLPWTQNIKVMGNVTTLYQEQRPQQLNSPIPGKIIKWYVKNGDYVKKGDTILQLSEVKDDYFDPLLVKRTEQQVEAKKGVRDYYEAKVGATNSQLQALSTAKDLKLNQIDIKISQLKNKLAGEEAELAAAKNELKLSEDQYARQKKMYDEGLVSLTQFQQRSISYQNAIAKKTASENKVLQTRQEISNMAIEQNAVIQDYTEKLSKTEGERFQSMGQIEGSEGDIAKLENQVANYKFRQGLYFIVASQDGQIVQLNKAGIGEILKETESIGIIVPKTVDYAVEIYIKPVDLPLIKEGQRVMCIFDGFPAIVFSGWPDSSYGTFAGKVIAIENNISANGLFKALIVEDKTQKRWPPKIRMGTGVQGIAILNDVPIWYELWRNINGFPPDYYEVKTAKTSQNEKQK